jgi:RsiW-degrading membrane proteinase PrsW (M82 family)
MVLLLLLIATAPGIFLLWYFYHRDRYEPEPKKKILKIFLLGALMVIPAFIIELVLEWTLAQVASGIVSIFIVTFIIVGPTEELLKFLVVKKWIYHSPEFDEVMDGIVYTVSASLGFATVENILYVLESGIEIGIARAFLSVPGHAFYGALMGYYIGLAKWNKARERRLMTHGIVLAILAHGLYNFLIFTKTVFALLVIVLIIGLGLRARRSLKLASRYSIPVDSAGTPSAPSGDTQPNSDQTRP